VGALQAVAASAEHEGRVCGVCQTAIAQGEEVGPCPSCAAPFHVECWEENGGCAQYGCAHMPAAVKEQAPVSAQTYWGQEEKDCPRCGMQIKVAALRCRHCGALFESGAPVTAAQLDQQAEGAARTARASTAALWLFAAGLLPLTAPLALVAGGLWVALRWRTVRSLPSNRRVMALLGLVAAGFTTLLLLLAALFLGQGAGAGEP
jgi:hypothetical protein